MKGHPKSYLDPAYDTLEAAVTKKLGLPEGLLGAIRTKGERSDADEVSSAGARTVFQITPATRQAAIKKWGLDPYASGANAVEVAGRVLKDSLDATGGDTVEAVTRYIAGTGAPRGETTRRYVARVTGQAQPAPAGAGRAAVAPQRVVDAYNDGSMSAADRANIDKALKAGQLTLPPGVALHAPEGAAKPDAGVAVIPKRVIDNYLNHSDMTDAQRDLIDRDVAAGTLRVPQGVKLTRPGPRTAADYAGITGRAAGRGVGGLRDLLEPIVNPLSTAQHALGMVSDVADVFNPAGAPAAPTPTTGYRPSAGARENIDTKFTAAGVAAPETRGERLYSAAVEGAAQGPAGGALAEGRVLVPVLRDIVSGGASGLASEGAAQAGAPEAVQLAAGLAAGGGTAVGAERAAGVAERVAAKFGPQVAKVVETTPREVLLDENGQFTDEGREIIARAKVEPEALKAAYEEAAAPQAKAQADQTVRVFEGVEHPVEVVGAAERSAADGRDYVPVRTPDGQEGYVPADEVITKPAPEAEAPLRQVEPTPEAVTPAPEAPLPASAAARMAEAKSVGVNLTKGEATKDFATQAAESDLSGTNTPEGRAVREFKAAQAEAIKQAADDFRATLGDTSLNAADRGAALKAGLRDLADQGKQGVTAAYKLVRDMAAELGDNAKGLTELDPAPIRAGVREILADDTVSDATRKGLAQIAAKYGLIGESPKHVPDTGMTTVMVRDAENNLVKGPSFAGQVEKLDLTNAEKFRQRLNDLYDKMATRNPQEALKPILDDAVADAAERAAKEGFGDVGRAATQAREAFKTQKATFEAKDVVNDLIAWKNGTQTEKINPERVWSIVFGQGPDALTNIKKLRAILLNKPTAASKAAWEAIKAQSAADLFQKALVTNANGGEGAISGAKLRSARQKFGTEKLKLILGDEQFNSYMRLERVIGDATIPLPKTQNPSGSGHLIARFLGQTAKGATGAARLVPGVGPVVDAVAGLAKQGIERARAEKTAEAAVNFTPEQAAAADAKAAPKAAAQVEQPKVDPAQAIRQFIELGSSNRLLAPLLASTAASQEEDTK